MEIQFGTKNNANMQAQLSQLVYSGSYFVGLKMSKVAQGMTHLQLEKVQLQSSEVKDSSKGDRKVALTFFGE